MFTLQMATPSVTLILIGIPSVTPAVSLNSKNKEDTINDKDMFIDTYPSVRPPMQLNMQIIQDKIRVDHSSSAF